MQDVFENAYIEKLQRVYEKSVEARTLEKRRMFIKFKKFLFSNRIVTYANEEIDRTMTIIENMPFKLIHMKEQWDGEKSYREMEHPEL